MKIINPRRRSLLKVEMPLTGGKKEKRKEKRKNKIK
jgi:hypothetical protein